MEKDPRDYGPYKPGKTNHQDLGRIFRKEFWKLKYFENLIF